MLLIPGLQIKLATKDDAGNNVFGNQIQDPRHCDLIILFPHQVLEWSHRQT